MPSREKTTFFFRPKKFSSKNLRRFLLRKRPFIRLTKIACVETGGMKLHVPGRSSLWWLTAYAETNSMAASKKGSADVLLSNNEGATKHKQKKMRESNRTIEWFIEHAVMNMAVIIRCFINFQP